MFYFVTVEYWNGEKRTLEFFERANARTIFEALTYIAVDSRENIMRISFWCSDCDNDITITSVHF